MTVLIGYITPRNAERMLASNQTDVGAEIDHLRNGGYVGRGMRMQLTPHGFQVQVSGSALAGYYVEPAHLHPTPLERGTTHFEQYSKLQPPAKPVALQEALPEPKPPRFRWVRRRFKPAYPEDKEHDTCEGYTLTVRCFPRQGRRKVRLHREVPRKPQMPGWLEARYGYLAELTELCAHVPVDASVDMRYQPHNGFRSQRKEKGCGTRTKSDPTKAYMKAQTHRKMRRRLNQVIAMALRGEDIDFTIKLPRLTYQGWSE